jgi:hypothetical protein
MKNNSENTPRSSAQEASAADSDLHDDPIWDLLRQSPGVQASPQFADRVMRQIRTQEATALGGMAAWWQRFFAPKVLWSCGAAAAIALGSYVAVTLVPEPQGTLVVQHDVDEFASLEEVANQELLLAATDHLNDFSDTELVSLISY